MKPEFWLDRWDIGRIGFHRDTVNPNLSRWWPELELGPEKRILVPLCGKSLDLHWLAERHPTTGIELAPQAVNAFWTESDLTPTVDQVEPYERSQHEQLTVLCGDFFALRPSHIEPVQGFYDRASLIALPPALRPQYVAALCRVLSAGSIGLMVTVEYDIEEEVGPPFSISPQCAAETLGEEFTTVHLSEKTLDAPGGLAERGIIKLKENVIKVHYTGGDGKRL